MSNYHNLTFEVTRASRGAWVVYVSLRYPPKNRLIRSVKARWLWLALTKAYLTNRDDTDDEWPSPDEAQEILDVLDRNDTDGQVGT